MAITLLQLRNRVREKADIENATDRHTDAQIDVHINDAIDELFLLANRYGVFRVEKKYEFTATGAASYALPADFFATVGVWLKKADYSIPLYRHDITDRPFAGPAETGNADNGGTYREAFFDDGTPAWEIELFPTPSTGDYVVTYIPLPTELSDDADELNVFTGIAGWDNFIVLYAAIQIKERDDLPFDSLENKLMKLEARIQEEAELRNLGEARIVGDRRLRLYNEGDWYPGRRYRGEW